MFGCFIYKNVLKCKCFIFLMLLEDNVNLGIKEGHFLWGALQLSLILILLVLIRRVRMSVWGRSHDQCADLCR